MNDKSYSQMLLDGMEEVRVHLAEWGRGADVGDEVNLASGWIVGSISEQITALVNDTIRREVIDQIGPAYLETMRDLREGGAFGDG